MIRSGYAEVIGAAIGGVANAGWFGDGRDGDLIVPDGEELVLDVALDIGQVVKQYNNVYIGRGATVKTSGRCNGMVWAVRGDFECHGHISMDKCAPLFNPMEAEAVKERHIALARRLGDLVGGNGGNAGKGEDNYNKGLPGVGGIGFELGGGFGSGSGSATLNGGNGEPRAPYGTEIPYRDASLSGDSEQRMLYGAGGNCSGPLSQIYYGGKGYGGSGAAVFAPDNSENRGFKAGNDGEAIGGGLFCLFVAGRVVVGADGAITANGGDGADGVCATPSWTTEWTSWTGGGGAAGGGIIVIVHNGDYSIAGKVEALRGKGGASDPNGHSGSANGENYFAAAGDDGEDGTVRIVPISELLNLPKSEVI